MMLIMLRLLVESSRPTLRPLRQTWLVWLRYEMLILKNLFLDLFVQLTRCQSCTNNTTVEAIRIHGRRI